MTNRRNFIKKSGLLVASGTLPFSNFMFSDQKRKLGVALVGLGYYSRDLLAPALQLTEHCELRGIVTGSPEKIPVWKSRYGIPDQNIYDYENMHQIANNEDIDVVYIVLPNGLHMKYAVIAANAGKHVWCEKPMALNEKECLSIIEACSKNKVQLTIGYRMQHEPVTQQIMEWAATKPYGDIRSLYAEAGFRSGGTNPDHWKLHPELGGGALYDMGVYPLNAVRYATKMEPLSVSARMEVLRPDIFKVDETTYFDMEFPEGIQVKCKTSFAESMNHLKVNCSEGWYELKPFQSYSGVSGRSSDAKVLEAFRGNQQARQMDDDALAIMNKHQPLVPGEEGLKDIRIVEAIMKSAANGGKRISLQEL